MTKTLDMAHPPCGDRCARVVARPAPDVPDSTGFRRGVRDGTSGAASNRRRAPLVKMNVEGFLKASGRYRERVEVEIGKASERGARRWSRRLVRLYEDVGLVRLDK
jgi:hypothetical protein